ncbi:uncharacterized protein LOC122082219 [Macadamia integrifolia]|uniref:uncharacterized protein LOC122082219 n=1 Tax=Macadamia integrifolia TaxID=60698 RepID=UPI001C502112|nr:uncharacterized protein LOC122082219 [Macadamia integrifolia]
MGFAYPSILLLLAIKEDSDSRGFYSLSTKKVYQLNLPEARGRKCFSSCGWLITLGLDLEIHLFNPFSRTRVQIRLPPQSTFPNQYDLETDSEPDIYDPETDSEPDIYDPETDSEIEREYIRRVFMRKVILSSRPSKRIPCEDDDEKCVVMGMFSKHCKLAFLRLGDEIWTPIYTPEGIGISDVIYMNGQFYALSDEGKLVIVDISSPDPKTIEFAEPPECYNQCTHFYNPHFYLVESVGELFMLARYEDDCEGEDEEFGDGIVEGEYIEYGTHNYDKYF